MNFKKVLAYFLIIATLLCLSGCGAKSDAKKELDLIMQAFKTGNSEKINEYYNFDEISRFINPDKQDEMLSAVLKILPEMDYSISSVEKIDTDTVEISLTIKTLDFSGIMNRYIQEIKDMVEEKDYQKTISSMSQEEYQNLLADKMLSAIAQEKDEKIVKTVRVTMNKQNGKWRMTDGNDAFLRTMFGNLIDAVNSLI